MLWILQGLEIVILIKISRSSSLGALNFSSAYFCAKFALNIIATLLTVIRSLIYRWRFAQVLGGEHASLYVNLAAILVVSASLYSISMTSIIINWAINSPLSQVFVQTICQIRRFLRY